MIMSTASAAPGGRGPPERRLSRWSVPNDAENIVQNIEKLTGQKIERLAATPVATTAPVEDEEIAPEREPRSRRGRHGGDRAPRRAGYARIAGAGGSEVAAVAEPVSEARRNAASAPASSPRARAAERHAAAPPPKIASPNVNANANAAAATTPGSDGRQQPDDGPDDGWNGPIPGFLSAKFGE